MRLFLRLLKCSQPEVHARNADVSVCQGLNTAF
jgi:hypothetical protein